MIASVDQVRDDLSVFADVGSSPLNVDDNGREIVCRLTRNGSQITVRLRKEDGAITKSSNGIADRNYVSFKALIASEEFANLRMWASVQQQMLKMSDLKANSIPVKGRLLRDTNISDSTIDEVNVFLTDKSDEHLVSVLLVDGPAGIGKTYLIEQLALQRAESFFRTQEPLILHVKSRGRVLTFLQDLMAFSLQVMRLQVTFDQVPVLARLGLIQVAIDGFDELGDPNGYDTAWSQVRDLVQAITGDGTLILAGRETFIGRERLIKAVPRLGSGRHHVAVYSLLPVDPNTAKQWLQTQGVGDGRIREAEEWGLFEHDSYALRPFFLKRVRELLDEDIEFQTYPPLFSLVNSMVNREADKFPEPVSEAWAVSDRRKFVIGLLGEVARDMAENQSDSIEEEALAWLVEAVVEDKIDDELIRLLKNRVQAIAFLENDDRNNRRKFAHSEFYNYFLCYAIRQAVQQQEVPKFIRRTLIGPDLLVTMSYYIMSLDDDSASRVLMELLETKKLTSGMDRADRNLSALILSCLPIVDSSKIARLPGLNVDDAVVRGAVGNVTLEEASINQLDIRECDLSGVEFRNVTLATAIVDSTTRVSPSFPDPGWLQLIDRGKEEYVQGAAAADWLNKHGRRPSTEGMGPSYARIDETHKLVITLKKVCRVMLRQHWVRSDGEDHVNRLVNSLEWQILADVLRKHNLLEKRDNKQASGPPSAFYHVRHAREILMWDRGNMDVRRFLDDLERCVGDEAGA
ncbi:hypothetical protein ACUN0C_05295 [Faunimonas sp. B44]|uniref:hypothetical protein n=1 Tax=Faunimonas sp. B44 TaxID=3461493 RepID=UPI0040443B26